MTWRCIDSDPQGSASRWADLGNLGFPVSELVLGEQSVVTWAKEVQRIKADCVVIDTAPNDRSLGATSAISDLVLVPCTPSGLDLDATVRTLEIVDAVRVRLARRAAADLGAQPRRPPHAGGSTT